MSARRERVPSGRTNQQDNVGSKPLSARLSARSAPEVLSARNSARNSSRSAGYNGVGASIDMTLDTNRSNNSEMSTSEVIRRMRAKSDVVKAQRDSLEIEQLGPYNAFSRPRPSQHVPLRSALLDPEINNFPKCRTATELRKKIKASGTPHPSYDLDGDGWVSQEDFKLAKRFDFDGNGVLDPEERKIGQRVLAEEFFLRNAHQLKKFGKQISVRSHKQNVESLVNAECFERSYDILMQKERSLVAESSQPILDCMRFMGGEHILRHNFYTDKFDATAYNDIDAVPRHTLTRGLDDHAGSRNRLLFTRKEILRNETSYKLNKALDAIPMPNTRRKNLITNVAIENS